MTTLQIGKYTITGQCWASHGSILILHGWKIAFDCGTIPEEMIGKLMGCRHICITHGHGDHIGRLHSIPMLRKRKELDPATILLPGACVKDWLQAYASLAKINGGAPRLPRGTDVINVSTKPVTQVGKDLYIHALPTIHRVPSVGYVLTEIRRKLKKEYIGLPGKEIGQLKKDGVKITDDVEVPLFAYTGDTTIEGLLQHPMFLEAEVLITECTYIDDEIDEKTCKERGHIHLKELVEHHDKIKGQLVLCHFSPRFSKDEIIHAVDEMEWKKKPLLLI